MSASCQDWIACVRTVLYNNDDARDVVILTGASKEELMNTCVEWYKNVFRRSIDGESDLVHMFITCHVARLVDPVALKVGMAPCTILELLEARDRHNRDFFLRQIVYSSTADGAIALDAVFADVEDWSGTIRETIINDVTVVRVIANKYIEDGILLPEPTEYEEEFEAMCALLSSAETRNWLRAQPFYQRLAWILPAFEKKMREKYEFLSTIPILDGMEATDQSLSHAEIGRLTLSLAVLKACEQCAPWFVITPILLVPFGSEGIKHVGRLMHI